MICIEHTITYRSTRDIIKIKPIMDVHWGAKHCDERAFKRYLSERDENTYFLINGDLFDLIFYQDTKRYRQSQVKASTFGRDDVIDLMVDEMVDVLAPIADRIIGIGSGNHEDVITKYTGSNVLQRLCRRLGKGKPIPYLGYSSMINLSLRESKGKNGSRGRRITIRMHHGWGGGSRTQGADLTKFSKDMNHWDANIYVYGHVHRKQFDSVPRMGIVGTSLYPKPQLLVIGGTFLKTYSKTADPTYSEAKGYPPSEIGGLTICIQSNNTWLKYWVTE